MSALRERPRSAGAGRAARASGALRAGLRRVPRAAWLCALVAVLNALAWSLVTPPFEVPDENAHYAYVQQVAERGTVPHHLAVETSLSPAQDETLAAIGFYQMVGQKLNPAPFSQLQQDAIDNVEARRLATAGSGTALSATDNPPLYYALAAVPYKLASGSGVLGRLAAIRVLSALLAGLTVLLVFLFLAEALPGAPWAWPVGTLVVAFQPLFGFMSGGVNNDDLLYVFAAGLLWALARVFRRGLSPGTGALVGAMLGVGLVAKVTLVGFAPAVALALALGVVRAWRGARATALRGLAWAVGACAVPAGAYVIVNHFVWKRGAVPGGGIGSVASPVTARHFNFNEELSHIWQLWLPPVGMRRQFEHLSLWHTWFKGFFGTFGWLDYQLPEWFFNAALAVSLAVCVLALAHLALRRTALRRRAGEVVVYAAVVVGLAVEIGVQSYRFLIANGQQFEQGRYLLPLLALYAAIAVLAVRVGGRRWGPVLGVVLVCLAIGHDLLAQAVTFARFYA